MVTLYRLHIDCLKKTGMHLKYIRHFTEMVMEIAETIDERLALFENQCKNVVAQIKKLNKTLEILNYKCLHYKTANEA